MPKLPLRLRLHSLPSEGVAPVPSCFEFNVARPPTHAAASSILTPPQAEPTFHRGCLPHLMFGSESSGSTLSRWPRHPAEDVRPPEAEPGAVLFAGGLLGRRSRTTTASRSTCASTRTPTSSSPASQVGHVAKFVIQPVSKSCKQEASTEALRPKTAGLLSVATGQCLRAESLCACNTRCGPGAIMRVLALWPQVCSMTSSCVLASRARCTEPDPHATHEASPALLTKAQS